MGGAVQKATEIAEGGAYLAGQFSNPMSIDAHVKTTAPEIFRDLEKVDYIVCGVGSGGTAMGLKRYILENNLMTKVIGVEPEESPLLTKGWSGAHLIQGIGANFLPSILDCTMLDDIRTVEGQKAVRAVREIYALSGEKCGISSGAAYVVAKEIKAENPSKTVLAIFPDGGDRYDNSLYE
jgi:cysteine synthase A